MKIVKSFFLIGFTFALSQLSAQNYLGIPSSNYSGVMGTDLNPASFVDGRFVVDVNLGSANFGLWTDAISFSTSGMPKGWIKSFKPDSGSDPVVIGGSNPYNDWQVSSDTSISSSEYVWDKYFIKHYQNNDDRTYGIYNNIQIDVLNFMFHINPKIAVGFTSKFRSITNLTDVDPKLAILGENDFDYSSLWNQQFNEKLLNMNHLTWMEYGGIYSQVIKDDGEHFMKAGGKVKYLSGLASAYIHTSNFEYEINNKDTSAYLSGDFEYGYSSNIDNFMENGLVTTSKFGIGLDLGFVYEWRPDWQTYKYDMDGETNIWRRDQEKYTLRLGASILDIGGMRFEKGKMTQNFNVNDGELFDFRAAFKGVNSFSAVDSTIDSLIQNRAGWNKNTTESTFFMNTPTAFSLQADYHIWKWFYVNATGMFNLISKKNIDAVRVPTQISVTPSFDHAWFGLHLPLSYNKFSGLKFGGATRLGPLTIGVTDLKTLFASGEIRGMEFYAGLRVPVLYTHPDDMDNDKVSDKMDECKNVPGIWTFKGCPDTDNDGIKDTDDICPNEPGLAEFQGCPDKDGDKIADKDDDCPDLPGEMKFKGCPDTDNDSIIDPKDDCPEIAGLPAFNGCPDTDGDGIKDEDDACPDVAGPLVHNGCPDTDEDGLFDFIDECPETFGPKENNGCPWPDTDNDGLLDKDDKCPYLAGPIPNDGCPYQDTDNDGVLDKDDKCPNTPGPVANQGCPEIEKEVQEILNTAFDNLEFETGKDIIKSESLPSLGELAEVLLKRPEWKLQIAGHTDNVGNDQNNLVLSKKRAEAVKNFMISKGVDGERLSVLYFGETQPIASNDTPEGRQKNRRVEMTIIFE